MRDYKVSVNFAGFVGVENEYGPYCVTDKDSAKAMAIEDAIDDLTVQSVEKVNDGEYEVEVDFATFIGATNTYNIEADSEEEAREYAIEVAMDDLSAEIIE